MGMNLARLLLGIILAGLTWLVMGRFHGPEHADLSFHWACLGPSIAMLVGVFLSHSRSMVFAVNAGLLVGSSLMAWMGPILVSPEDPFLVFGLWAVHWFFGLAVLVIGILAVVFPTHREIPTHG
jgi:peptidoglycan/LPS O-acetylase OafA/YrhL